MHDTKYCPELLAVESERVPDDGCLECLASGDEWVHLRYCVTCKEIRCCDDSPNQHASKHAKADGHRVARSAEAHEMWAYCYEHDITLGDISFAKYMR